MTGGGSGLGSGTAQALARAGAKVAVDDTATEGGLETVESMRRQGGEAIFIKADVTQDKDVAAAIATVVEAWGRLDCAFNNAGILEEHMFLAGCPESVFDRIRNINVKGIWPCLKHEIPQMIKQGGGSIVNISSIVGLSGAPKMSAYSASKHAVLGLTRSAALEVARKKIRINTVCPGVIRTPMYDRALVADPQLPGVNDGDDPGRAHRRGRRCGRGRAVAMLGHRAVHGRTCAVDRRRGQGRLSLTRDATLGSSSRSKLRRPRPVGSRRGDPPRHAHLVPVGPGSCPGCAGRHSGEEAPRHPLPCPRRPQ